MTRKREFTMVRPSELKMPPYQRALNEAKIKKIANEWNICLVEPIKVSKRPNGDLMVMDGQHTLTAWMLKEGDEFIGAIIYTDLSYEEEAELFIKFNTNKTRVSFNENILAAREAGGIAATEYISALESAGYHFKIKGNGLTCHKIVSDLWRKMDNNYFISIMKIYRNYMPLSVDMYKQEVIGGYLLFATAYSEVDRFKKRLTYILPKMNATEISASAGNIYIDKYRKAPGNTHGGKMLYCCALVFLDKYNYRLSEDEKLDWEYLGIVENNISNFKSYKPSLLKI